MNVILFFCLLTNYAHKYIKKGKIWSQEKNGFDLFKHLFRILIFIFIFVFITNMKYASFLFMEELNMITQCRPTIYHILLYTFWCSEFLCNTTQLCPMHACNQHISIVSLFYVSGLFFLLHLSIIFGVGLLIYFSYHSLFLF